MLNIGGILSNILNRRKTPDFQPVSKKETKLSSQIIKKTKAWFPVFCQPEIFIFYN
jgi:hypothetical protein